MPGNWERIERPPLYSNYASQNEYFFEKEFSRLIDSEARNTNNIIAGNKELAIELRSQIEVFSGNISRSIHDSNKILDARLVDLIWLIEQQGNEMISALNKIGQMLSKPNATEAKEFRDRGNEAYRNGWYKEAEQEYLKSIEKNPYDFSVYHSLGNIYLFNTDKLDNQQKKENHQQAAECYRKAIKYAEPYSKDFAVFSSIHLAQSYNLLHDFASAYKVTLNLTRQFPDFLEARYLHAQYCVLLGKNDEALQNIIMLTTKNIGYILFLDKDPLFSPIQPQIQKICQTLIDKYKAQSNDFIIKIDKCINEFKRDKISGKELFELCTRYNNIKERYYNDNSLLGYYFAALHLMNLYNNLLKALTQIWVDKKKEADRLKREKIPNYLDGIFCILSIYVTYNLYAFIFAEDGLGYLMHSIDSYLAITFFALIFLLFGFYTIKLVKPAIESVIRGSCWLFTKLNLIKGPFPYKDELISPTNRLFGLLTLTWATLPFPLLITMWGHPSIDFPVIIEPPVLSIFVYQIIMLPGILLVGMVIRAIILHPIVCSRFVRELSAEQIIDMRLKNFQR